MRLRTFIGNMGQSFGWKMKLHDFSGEKMLNAVVAALFSKRLKKYEKYGYDIPTPTEDWRTVIG